MKNSYCTGHNFQVKSQHYTVHSPLPPIKITEVIRLQGSKFFVKMTCKKIKIFELSVCKNTQYT